MYYKDYANYIGIIFGKRKEELDETFINTNPELAAIVEQQIMELWDPFALEYTAVDRVILKGRNDTEILADYIRKNAHTLADLSINRALRQRRRPEQIERLRPFLKYNEEH